MSRYFIVVLAAGCAGCATRPIPEAVVVQPVNADERQIVREHVPTRLVETRYDVRHYHDAAEPTVRHEAHAVYRTTRVPARVVALETAPRIGVEPVTYAPLPEPEELRAVIAMQKQTAEEMREIHARMESVERKAQAEYSELKRQTAAAAQLRRHLEAQRSRAAESDVAAPDPAARAVPPRARGSGAGEPKW